MAKYTGFLTGWGRATTSGFGTVATINNVTSVTPGFGSERTLYDQSAYGDNWMDWAVLQQDGVEFTSTLLWDPADAVHLLLKGDYETPNPNTWIRAAHTASGKNYNITTVCRALTWNPARDGGFEAAFVFKIVNPGVVMV